MQENFEAMIESLKENRQKLNQSNSFDEISVLWHQIKETYSQCTKVVDNIAQELSLLEGQQFEADGLDELKFSDALKKMQELSEKVKAVSITEVPGLIKQMQTLKMFCLNKLEEEKVKMEEVQ